MGPRSFRSQFISAAEDIGGMSPSVLPPIPGRILNRYANPVTKPSFCPRLCREAMLAPAPSVRPDATLANSSNKRAIHIPVPGRTPCSSSRWNYQQWQVRRIVYDAGEWHCALSRQRELPDWVRSIGASLSPGSSRSRFCRRAGRRAVRRQPNQTGAASVTAFAAWKPLYVRRSADRTILRRNRTCVSSAAEHEFDT